MATLLRIKIYWGSNVKSIFARLHLSPLNLLFFAPESAFFFPWKLINKLIWSSWLHLSQNYYQFYGSEKSHWNFKTVDLTSFKFGYTKIIVNTKILNAVYNLSVLAKVLFNTIEYFLVNSSIVLKYKVYHMRMSLLRSAGEYINYMFDENIDVQMVMIL